MGLTHRQLHRGWFSVLPLVAVPVHLTLLWWDAAAHPLAIENYMVRGGAVQLLKEREEVLRMVDRRARRLRAIGRHWCVLAVLIYSSRGIISSRKENKCPIFP
ncbi:hypothetical protein FB451DRAFT_1193844 [Mycena latifolia]|nr:hypothetical protein FB451DRAFT_1193844 [Mycena latifolia]